MGATPRFTRAAGVTIALCWALSVPRPASACGGLFCNLQQVEQAGERVVFSYEPDGSVTTVVQIRYAGSSNDFAWIIPVPAAPEVSLGATALFAELERSTQPLPTTSARVDGSCRVRRACPVADPCGPGRLCLDGGAATPTPPEVPPAPPPPELATGRVAELGPYAIATLAASDPEALERWLTDNGFTLPPGAGAALAPYLETPHHFVALRLRQDRERGEIQPIVVRSSSPEPCIPLRLTAIAATEDMPVTVYVLADRRARPASWLLVEPDLADLGFWRGETPYADIVSRSVDAAGGHAFVTDYAGPVPTDLRIAAALSEESLASAADPMGFVRRLSPLLGEGALLPILRRHLPAPIRAAERLFYGCLATERFCGGGTPSYVRMLEERFDSAAAAREIEVAILGPRREGQRMVDSHDRLTRLFTTISPDEMTDDPIFALSVELPPTRSNVLEATYVTQCSNEYQLEHAPLVLEVPSGITVPVEPGERALARACPAIDEGSRHGASCGVGADGPPTSAAPALLALLFALRRRSARRSR